MKKAKFELLEYGNKLAKINTKGEYKFYTYLCLDPGFKSKYAILLHEDGINASHFTKEAIEEMYVYKTFDEVLKLADETKAAFYTHWLELYNDGKNITYIK